MQLLVGRGFKRSGLKGRLEEPCDPFVHPQVNHEVNAILAPSVDHGMWQAEIVVPTFALAHLDSFLIEPELHPWIRDHWDMKSNLPVLVA